MIETMLMKESVSGEGDVLLAGTMDHGWFGEVSAEDFITGDALAAQIGLTAGIAFNSDAGWLKFSLENRTLYVAKRPFRYNLMGNDLYYLGVVYGNLQITVSGKRYKVRLLKGRGDGLTTTTPEGNDTESTWGSEWNRLMYHVSASPNGGAMTSEGISVGDWAQFSDEELGAVGYGSRTLCQERATTTIFIRRMAAIQRITNANINVANGWRPCLELVD